MERVDTPIVAAVGAARKIRIVISTKLAVQYPDHGLQRTIIVPNAGGHSEVIGLMKASVVFVVDPFGLRRRKRTLPNPVLVPDVVRDRLGKHVHIQKLLDALKYGFWFTSAHHS